MKKLPIIANIESFGRVVEVADDFYAELQQLKAGGAALISPRDEAYVRLQTRGKENVGQRYGTRTTGGFEYAKGRLPIFKVNSRLTNPRIARLAVKANVGGSYFHTATTKEFEESAKQAEREVKAGVEPKDRTVIFLPSRETFKMDNKTHWDIYETALKDQAKPFFEFNDPITVYPVSETDVDSQNGTLLTHLWFGGLDDRSDFGGDGRYLGNVSRARGVLASAEGAKPAQVLPYTQRDLDKYLKIVQGVRATNLPASQLEKVAEFLEGLKQ